MIAVTLPYPPSANRLWRAVNGRNIKSAEYRQWLVKARACIPVEARGKITGPYFMAVRADRPDRRARDLTNLLKPTEDALLFDKAQPLLKGVVRDDSDAAGVAIVWSDREPGKGAEIHIELEEVPA